MLRRPLATAVVACVLLAGCGGDDEGDGTTAGAATATATQTATTATTATTPATTGPSTTGGTQAPADREGAPEQQDVDAVRECLRRQGYRATGGVRPPGTANAPSYEILVAGPRGGAFIAFHDTLAQARRYHARVRRNAGRFKDASVERQGTITTVWVELTDATARGRIRDCVRQVS